MANPEPLNLDFKKFFERFREVYNILRIQDLALDYEYAIKLGMYYMYRKIKSACEFYLRYKDNPKLLISEHKEYYDDVVGNFFRSFNSKTLEEYYDIDKYNEWLFKLAFNDVLNGGENDEKR